MAATRSLFRDPSLQSGLTLPLVNPPLKLGLLNCFSGLLAVARQLGGVQNRHDDDGDDGDDDDDGRILTGMMV